MSGGERGFLVRWNGRRRPRRRRCRCTASSRAGNSLDIVSSLNLNAAKAGVLKDAKATEEAKKNAKKTIEAQENAITANSVAQESLAESSRPQFRCGLRFQRRREF